MQDNATMHMAAIFLTSGQECRFYMIDYQPTNLDHIPSDYFPFPKLKSTLRTWRCYSNEVVPQAVLHLNVKTIFHGIKALLHHCEKCVELKADYIAKY